MVLGSQSQRRGFSGAYTSTFRRKRQRVLRIAGVVVVIGGVFTVAYIWINSGNKAAGPATLTALEPANNSVSHNDLVTTRPAPTIIAQADTKPPTPTAPAPAPKPATAPAVTTPPTLAPKPDPAPPTAVQPRPGDVASPEVKRLIDSGRELAAKGDLVQARATLNKALQAASLAADAEVARDEISGINQKLIFSPQIADNDPAVTSYVVQPGDNLTRIALKTHVPYQFISAINNNLDPRRLRVGQRLKLVNGPFHIVVHKKSFRLDLYLGDPTGPAGVYVRSFRVGLGEHGSTPTGQFLVRAGGKLIKPEWTNPRTGQRFLADDPKNPLGGYWMGLRGIDPGTEPLKGYGVHGTIAPESIGTEASMGCVRLVADDIKLLFSMLEEEQTHVTIID
jgi:LysM repeat protein